MTKVFIELFAPGYTMRNETETLVEIHGLDHFVAERGYLPGDIVAISALPVGEALLLDDPAWHKVYRLI